MWDRRAIPIWWQGRPSSFRYSISPSAWPAWPESAAAPDLQAPGAEPPEEARRVSAFSLWLGIFISAAFALGWRLYGACPGLPGRWGEHLRLCPAVRLLCHCGRRRPPPFCPTCSPTWVRSIGRSRVGPGPGIVLGGVLNIILDPLFMFVLMPDGCEVLGAGAATALSNCVACLYFSPRPGPPGQAAPIGPHLPPGRRASPALQHPGYLRRGYPLRHHHLPVRSGLCGHRQADGVLPRPGPGPPSALC